MSTLPFVTAFYAALAGLLAAFLTINVIRNRVRLKIDDVDGNNVEMRRAIRAHGNFAEHAPLILILMGAAEMGGSPKYAIHIIGIALVVARLLSAWGLSHTLGQSFGRQSGAGLSVLTYIAAAVLILLRIGGVI
jgi:uncharacterized membrane protein YecN with MAPEG domain